MLVKTTIRKSYEYLIKNIKFEKKKIELSKRYKINNSFKLNIFKIRLLAFNSFFCKYNLPYINN